MSQATVDTQGVYNFIPCSSHYALSYCLDILLMIIASDMREKYRVTKHTNSNNHAAILEFNLAATTEFCNNQIKFLVLT